MDAKLKGFCLRVPLVVLTLVFGLIWAAAPVHAGRIEAGHFTAHATAGGGGSPRRVNFQQTFDVAPIVIAIASTQGNHSATIRITNVSTTGFDELTIEADNWDGTHVAMNIHYIAVEPGRHVLPDGTVIEAGRTALSNVQFGTGFSGSTASWQNVAFSAALQSTPVVLHNLQTANSETRNVPSQTSRPFITSIASNPSISGFRLALDRSQANTGPWPSTETVGWVAFPSAETGSFLDTGNGQIDWSTVTTSATVRGMDNGCTSYQHGLSAVASQVVAVAKKITRNNADGGWFRYCAINGQNISLLIDEDRDQDNERSVTGGDQESAAIIAFSRSFHALLEPELNVTKARTATDDGQGGDFSIPGALVDYMIAVSNSGNSPPNANSVMVTEALPDALDLVVTGYSGPSTSPVSFEQGSPASNLNCPFISLSSTSDCVEFSTDGINFGYAPVDSGDGTDPAVRYIRVRPSGFMLGDTGSGAPSFTLKLQARVK